MRKTSFEGQIEQAVAGDVINKGTRIDNSNVINLHLKGSTEEQQLSGEYLTFQQENEIRKLVNQIIEVTETESLKVWNQVLARAGAKKFKSIPKEHYVELEKYLNSWLNEVKQAAAQAKIKIMPPAPVATPTLSNNPIAERQRAVACIKCEAAKEEISSTRKMMLAAALVACFSTIGVMFAGFKVYNLNKSLQTTQARLNACEYAGETYAIGSVRHDQNNVNYECVKVSNENSTQWKITTPSVRTDKKAIAPKSRIYRRVPTELDDNVIYESNVTQ